MFQRFVASYIDSDLGRDTPPSVANALRAIDPVLYRFDAHPSLKRLHRIRLVIQEAHERRAGVSSDTGTMPTLRVLAEAKRTSNA